MTFSDIADPDHGELGRHFTAALRIPLAAIAFLAIAVFRHTSDGSDSLLLPLVFVPLAWLAITGARWEVLSGLVMTAAVMLIPILIYGPPQYSDQEWARALIYLVVAMPLTLAVQFRMDEIRNRLREMSILDSASRRLTKSLSVGEVCRAVTQSAAAICSPPGEAQKRAQIFKLDPDNPELASIIGEWDESGIAVAGPKFPARQHPIGYIAITEGTPYIGPLDYSKFGPAVVAALKAVGARHGAYVALRVHDEIFGIVAIAGRQRRGFGDAQLKRLLALASMGSLALTNAQAHEDLEATATKLAELAAKDPLTGLSNRREFDNVISHLPREPFSIIAIDIDNLKTVNDTHGHEAGDVLIKTVGATLDGALRTGDVMARLGGDEFCALIHGADAETVKVVSSRMQEALAATILPSGRPSVSIGCASGTEKSDPHEVAKAADEALYAAKRAGKDRVAVHPGTGV